MNPRADILIVTATKIESQSVLCGFAAATGQNASPVSIGERVYYDLGEVNGARVFMALSEMGAAGIGASQQAVQKGIAALRPHAVIMVGVAFGITAQKQAIGDVLISKQLMLYEFQQIGDRALIPCGDQPHAATKLINYFQSANLGWSMANVHFGLVLTGEKLIDNMDYRAQLQRLAPTAIGGEMEGGGLYVACHDAKVDWILVKAIGDWASGSKEPDRESNHKLAADHATAFVLHALHHASLNRSPSPEIAALPARPRTDQHIKIEWNKVVVGEEKFFTEKAERYAPSRTRAEVQVVDWKPHYTIPRARGANAQHNAPSDQKPRELIETIRNARQLIVLGEPGSGKSTGIYLAIQKAAATYAEQPEALRRIPLYVELAKFHHRKDTRPRDTLLELLVDEIARFMSVSADKILRVDLEHALIEKKFLIIFDGLNEVMDAERIICLEGLIDFSERYQNTNIVVSARKFGYTGELPFPAVELLELSRQCIGDYITRAVGDNGESARIFFDQLGHQQRRFAQNPFALHLMVDCFLQNHQLPRNRALIFADYVDCRLKDLQNRKHRAGQPELPIVRCLNALMDIALQMKECGLHIDEAIALELVAKENSTLADNKKLLGQLLETGLLIRDDSGHSYRFFHQNIQEYFCVARIAALWEGSAADQGAGARLIRKYFKTPAWWETLSMAIGLLHSDSVARFLRRCARTDDFLLAMAIAQTDLDCTKWIKSLSRKTLATINFIDYLSAFLKWPSIVFASITIQVLIGINLQFGGHFEIFHAIHRRFILPMIPYGFSASTINISLCALIGISFRRVLDWIILGPMQTLLRSLQQIGTISAKQALAEVHHVYIKSNRLALDHQQAIGRILFSPPETAEEVIQSLSRGENTLYSATLLGKIGDENAAPALYSAIQQSRDSATIDACIGAIGDLRNRDVIEPRDSKLVAVLSGLLQRSEVPIASRLAAYNLLPNPSDFEPPQMSLRDHAWRCYSYKSEFVTLAIFFLAGAMFYWGRPDTRPESVFRVLDTLLRKYAGALAEPLTILDTKDWSLLGLWLMAAYIYLVVRMCKFLDRSTGLFMEGRYKKIWKARL